MNKILILFLLVFNINFSQEIPQLKQWATDYTNTLNGKELDYLNKKLSTFFDSTSNQVVSLMIKSLNDYPIEEYALAVAEKNKIGTKENDNGLLLLVAKEDKQLRIEVGYGLEGALPDALSSSIIRNIIIPHFKNNDYYNGINAGLDAIFSAIKGEYSPQFIEEEEIPMNVIMNIIWIGLILFISLFRRKRRTDGGFVHYGGIGGLGGLGGYKGRSGGFGGGGFGGLGGGFGGGGASGRW